jgi:hypothetical protein
VQPPPPKFIYIVGCNHALQVPRDQWSPAEYEQQIAEYRRELVTLTDRYGFNLYCEEVKQSAFSFAEKLAIDRHRRYVNIDMPKDVREILGIPRDYAHPDNPGGYAPNQILQWHIRREAYMFDRATDRMQTDTVAIVICGDEHVMRLKARFEELGGKVEAESFLNKLWYRPAVFKTETYL